ncbi:MAG: pyruvate ferredoxin oxidoreductase, gamma subunit [Parcubacteria group bacterium Athens1014_10]|nr:MAG: pyruvate ferredoxin oxidoreductase, gamma subunit [Parcubacteria group bacterium Athens1014_10]TSD05189.1 MAG: pyruvate ferredoxin oxidoreductase, gamma subunit [Parcubacteria group bacterium Athens0714_12]
MDMFEITICGRGGQGSKLAAQILAEAALEDGKYSQAFSQYGPERTGAPVTSYARISNQPILTHQPIIKPNAVLILDSSLLKDLNFNNDEVLIINICPNIKLEKLKNKTYKIDASDIALKILGKDLPNVAMLGALIKITDLLKLPSLEKRIKEYFAKKYNDKMAEQNIKALQEGYKTILCPVVQFRK